MDSIIARPTNKVRVMVAEASGCCASELNAVETARPSPSAGPMLPSADREAGGDDRSDRDESHAIHSVSFSLSSSRCFTACDQVQASAGGRAWRPRCKPRPGC